MDPPPTGPELYELSPTHPLEDYQPSMGCVGKDRHADGRSMQIEDEVKANTGSAEGSLG